MPFSVRLDKETEALLNITARALDTTKSEILKASIHDLCSKTLWQEKKKPYELIPEFCTKIALHAAGGQVTVSRLPRYHDFTE